MSTGSQLPFDAGKYNLCLGKPHTRYFYTTMQGTLKSSGKGLPLKLGICLVDVCTHDDVVDILENSAPFIASLIGQGFASFSLSDVLPSDPKTDIKGPDSFGWVVGIFLALLVILVGVSTWLVNRVTKNQAAARARADTDSLLNFAESVVAPSTSGDGGGVVGPPAAANVTNNGANGGYSSSPTEEARAAATESTSSSASVPTTTSTTTPAAQLVDHTRTPQQTLPARTRTAANDPQPDPAAALPLVVRAWSLTGKDGTLTKLVDTSAPYRRTDHLNGIRVIGMLWIVLGHSFLMPAAIMGYMNSEDIVRNDILDVPAAEDSPWFMLIMSAELSVDTFFFMSGFLLSFLFVQEVRKKAPRARAGSSSGSSGTAAEQGGSSSGNPTSLEGGRPKKSPLGTYFSTLGSALMFRYIRLTPSLALAMVIYWKLMVLWASGPFGQTYQNSITDRCEGSWWSELLYTMNFIPFDSDKVFVSL